jgi:hypothetical protein
MSNSKAEWNYSSIRLSFILEGIGQSEGAVRSGSGGDGKALGGYV